MANDICLNCFKEKGKFDVCPYCGWVEGTPPEQAYHLHPGVTLSGRYIIGTVSGFGGFGTIYKAWDSQLASIVAIKEFYPAGLVSRVPGTKDVVIFSGEKKDNYLQAKQRFLSEAKNLAMFNKNPNIVNVYNFFEENDTAYIVMEYLDGVSLRDYLNQNAGRLSVDVALEIIRPIMDALIAIHDKGIVHRDIHPGNIFLTTDSKVKLLDFGAARLSKGEDEATLTVVVTQGYASPEQYRTKSKQGPFTDIYGLGATLYKMITNVLPEESLDRQVKDNLKKPTELGVKIDENLNRTIMKAIALKPDIRFQKVADFRDAVYKNNKVDYPEVEFNKRKTRRRILIAGVMVVLVALIVTVSLYATVLRPTQTLESITIDGDEITIWLPVSDDTEQRDLQVNGYQTIVDSFQNDYEDLNVNVVPVPESEYSEKMIEASKEGGMPTLFRTDDVSDYSEYSTPLDLLYNSINPKEYLFLDDYDALFPSKDVMPLGFDVSILYANNEVAKVENKTIPVSMPDLTTLLGDNNSARVLRKDMPGFLLLYSGNLVTSSGISANESLINTVAELSQSYSAQKVDINDDPVRLLEGDQLLYLFGSTSDLRTVQSTLPGYYSVVVVESDGKLAGAFADTWAVSRTATDNQQNAAMLFMAYLLNDFSQDELYLQQDSVMPINKTIFEQYVQLNPDFELLLNRESDIKIVGEYSSQLYALSEDVYNEILSADMTKEQIKSFFDASGETSG